MSGSGGIVRNKTILNGIYFLAEETESQQINTTQYIIISAVKTVNRIDIKEKSKGDHFI